MLLMLLLLLLLVVFLLLLLVFRVFDINISRLNGGRRNSLLPSMGKSSCLFRLESAIFRYRSNLPCGDGSYLASALYSYIFSNKI